MTQEGKISRGRQSAARDGPIANSYLDDLARGLAENTFSRLQVMKGVAGGILAAALPSLSCTKDQVRTGYISGKTFDRKKVTYEVIDGRAIFEGDIILGTVEQFEQSEGKGPHTEGVAIPGSGSRWPRGRIPWGLRRFNPQLEALVRQAIQHWEANTQIRFVERTAANQDRFPDYLSFRADGDPTVCGNSPVGKQGGVQFVYLSMDPDCGFVTAVHEIGHAVGLWHEQSREDRNLYIRIRRENIQSGKEHNFRQRITDGDDVGRYDFDSIMHYSPDAFSKNGQPTIEPLGTNVIGTPTGLSAGDIAAARVLYQAPATLLASEPMGYRGGGAVRVVYRGQDSHPNEGEGKDNDVHEVRLTADGWQHWNMGDGIGAPFAAGAPMGYQGVGAARVVYRGYDDHVHEIWLSGDGWRHYDHTAALHAPLAAGDPMGYQATETDRLLYRGHDDHIHEIWLSGDGWRHYDHTAALRAPLAAGDPMGYRATETDRLLYRGHDDHVHEIWLSGDGWRHYDHTAALDAPLAAGDPMGYRATETDRLLYRGHDDHVHEIWLSGDGWRHYDHTAALHAPLAAGDPMGYRATETDRLLYRAHDDHVHEIWLSGDGWRHHNHTAALPGAAGDPMGYRTIGRDRLVYRGQDNHIHELVLAGDWHHEDLTPFARP